MKFYLGTHRPHWLNNATVPLFVSRRWLAPRKRLPRAGTRWALDSGGYTELTRYGDWTITAAQYAAEVARFQREIGYLDWAAPMDWMCEPWVLRNTGKTVLEHQHLTVLNYLELRDTGLPFIPVLQGYTLSDYLACVELYAAHNVDLTVEPVVGLGTICRRQNMQEAEIVVRRLHREGIGLHGFGIKVTGLDWYGDALRSADSMSWSYRARKAALAGEPSPCGRKSCSNCLHFALGWREALLKRPAVSHQLPMEAAV